MKITENFTYIGTQQNFERDSYATLAEMKAVVDKRMPDIFTATCKETGKFYIYNKNNEVDETLGKWREISIDGDDYVTKTYLDTELANKSNIDHTHTTVNNHTVESNVPADAKFTDTVYDDTEVKAEIAKKADATSIPSKVSVLENDSKYQTELDVTTTLTDYATKTYVGEQIAASDHLKREIVTVLPTDEDAKDNIIYMLKVESATGNDKYQEYMKIDGTVQLAGDTSVDLSDYAKIDDIPTVPSKVSELENDSKYQTSTDIRPIKADISNMGLQITNLQEVAGDHSTTIGNLKQYKADKSEMLVLIDGCAKPSDLHSHTNKELLDKITTDRAYGWDAAKTHADSEHAPVNARANIIETVKVNGAALEVSDKAVNVIVPTKVSELTDSSDYAKKTDIPTTLPANGGNANTVNNHTVKSDVPENAVFTDTVLEINDEGTSETTVWSSSKIASEITNEATTRQNADTALQSALALRKSYDFVVDSNETLLAWANCADGSMKSVLVKAGEYTLDGKEINLVNAGTKFVFAEDGNKINVTNYLRGIGATEDYGAVIVGLNIEVSHTGDEECFAFYRGMICYNCTGTGDNDGNSEGYGFYGCTCSNCTGTGTSISSSKGYGFYGCTCSNCTGIGRSGRGGTCYGFYNCTCSNCTGSGGGAYSNCYGFYGCTCSNCTGSGSSPGYGSGYGFYSCSYCSSCRAGETSSTATWGGTNTYIDSDSCDYVAS